MVDEPSSTRSGSRRWIALALAVVVGFAAVAAALYLSLSRPSESPPEEVLSVPPAPMSVQVTAGDGKATVSWGAVEDATAYNLYASAASGVTKTNYAGLPEGRKLEHVASPYTVSGLQNDRTYYLRLTALNAAGESGESAELSVTPQAAPPSTPLYVTGLVEFDSGAPVSGGQVTLSAEDGSAAAAGPTGADGRFDIPITPQFPTRVLAEVTFRRAGEPPVTGFRWSSLQGDGGAVDVGRIQLPDPAGKRLEKSGSAAWSADGSIRVSGLPADFDSVWARSYDPDQRPDVFPGDLAERQPSGATNPINSIVFLWISALDSNGNLKTDVNPAATVRLRVPPTQWVDLEDLVDSNGVYDAPIYSFDYASGWWVREPNGLLVDEAGAPIPESEELAVRTGTYSGNVYAVFQADHFSWWNVDKPPTGCGTDYGDADDPPYPSFDANNGAHHTTICRAWLGPWADGEGDADVPNLDLYDDSVLDNDPLTIRVSNWNWSTYLYLNVLIDKNSSGDWTDPGEWVVVNLPVSVPMFKSKAVEADAVWDGGTWMRVTLTGSPVGVPGGAWDGTGLFAIGETEDYPFLAFRLSVTVTGNGTVTSNPSGIDCRRTGGNCSAEYQSGTTVTLTATPDAGESFLGWGGDCAAAGTNATCDMLMDDDRAVSAAFTQSFYDLSVYVYGNGTVTSNPPGIDCHSGQGTPDPGGNGGVCTAVFAANTNVTLTETPDLNESFLTWGGDCASAGNNTTCVVYMDRNRWVYAQFTVAPYLSVYDWNSTGSGVVASAPPGIDCQIPYNTTGNRTACWNQFTRNTVVTLTATPDLGSSFQEWGGDCAAAGTNPTCVLTMDANKTVTAKFG